MINFAIPNWIPSLTAWMNSILLILLMRGLAVLIRIIAQMGQDLSSISPKLHIVLYFAAILSPILVVALAHHLLQMILDRYSPDTRSPESRSQLGPLPSLMSWWEGFYGWMAIALAFVVSNLIEVIFSRSLDSYELLGWWNELKDLFTLPTLYRVIIVAYLYQFEHLVRTHLMSVGSNSQSD